MNNIMMAI